VFSALLTAPNPNSLSILGNIETTSQETRRVPSGKGPCSLITIFLQEKKCRSVFARGLDEDCERNQLKKAI